LTEHDPERREMELGFMFDHSLMSETPRQALQASTAALALAQLLVEHGVIDDREFAERRSSLATELQEHVGQTGVGLFLNNAHEDKYALDQLPQINCAERVQLCKAACCTLRLRLSRQDVEEGTAQWDLGRPYWNRQDADGYCVHHDPEGGGCRIYEHRPDPCRVFDCRNDERIWSDFDAIVVNPELEQKLAAPRLRSPSQVRPSSRS
jgi:Fe-S-cluster containining protein